MNGVSSAECTAAPVRNQASRSETDPDLPPAIEPAGVVQFLRATLPGDVLEGVYLELHDHFGPQAVRAAKRERRRVQAKQREQQSYFAENRARFLEVGKFTVEELKRRRAAGETRAAAMRAIAEEQGVSVLFADTCAGLYRTEMRKAGRDDRSKRDATIWRMFRAGKSDAQIGRKVGLTPGSVNRILRRLRREARP